MSFRGTDLAPFGSKMIFSFLFSFRERKASFGFFNDWGEYTLDHMFSNWQNGETTWAV